MEFVCVKCRRDRTLELMSEVPGLPGWCRKCERRFHRPPRDPVPDYRDVMPPYKLVEFRAKFGMTQAGFAKAIGVSTPAVSSWEQGRTNIPKYIQMAMSCWLAGLPPYNG